VKLGNASQLNQLKAYSNSAKFAGEGEKTAELTAGLKPFGPKKSEARFGSEPKETMGMKLNATA
jgi:hypothetical protein